jgi:chemotaxis protein CheC
MKLCNICGSNAASALARLTDKEVGSEAPLRHTREELPAVIDAQQSFAVRLEIFGELAGSIVLLLPDHDARLLLGLLLGDDTPPDAPLSELAVSTLMEVGNIMASACLNAVGPRLQTALLPSVPGLVSGAARDLISDAFERVPGATVAIETRFSFAAPLCRGSLFLIPSPALLEAAGSWR